MDLILWRHAEAEDGMPDLGRALTAKGRKQAERMAAWLRERLPKETRILVSPAKRALQTAAALGLEYTVVDGIAPGADPAALLAAAGWPDASAPVLLVGHQPTLGLAAGLLLCGEERELGIKKGGVVWLTNRVRGGASGTVIKAVMTVEML
ncbi:MAG: histidine phosphatase family protein [Thiobacillaceae bacterium]|jgi:phosphohistidine phosphatase|nr:histidine phosphatase family protein [Thiobacillaceae bacterium]